MHSFFYFVFVFIIVIILVVCTFLLICSCNCHQEHVIQTRHGSVSVAVFGDQDKPGLVTYPDLALNRKCFAACSIRTIAYGVIFFTYSL